jgi:uncharacterized MAPEG superfamily protein
LIEGLSFSVYRRASTIIFVPAPRPAQASAVEMVAIDPRDLRPPRTGTRARLHRRSQNFRSDPAEVAAVAVNSASLADLRTSQD